MKNTKTLNLKTMKETIINYSGDQKEFDKIWNAFYMMTITGFISQETWEKFFNQCASWYVDEENACIRDSKDDSIIWEYNPEREYKA